MLLFILDTIERLVKKYTEAYVFTNRAPDLAVQLTARIGEEDKECLLNDIDYELRDYVSFSHEYENGRLQIIFK
ncbi:hypothetical protein [uncultured Methanobrevibacter sp.]|uniref:hypothetical protein n=1 Tax=uncultured Methanobrevibacter sp. TaxID=253161 RepID=UPI0025DEC23F|nr:hypothetical protein [uncultured Methanobrevibacter sp.]